MPCERSGVCTGDPGQDPSLADCGNVPEPDQGFLLVTEHIVFGSNHAPVITKDDWLSLPVAPGEGNRVIRQLCDKVVEAYWQMVRTMVGHGRNERHMSREECQAWVQTGLGLTPFCGYRMDSSLEWTIAWSLIGEWTSIGSCFCIPKAGRAIVTLPTSIRSMIKDLLPYIRGQGLALSRAHCPLS